MQWHSTSNFNGCILDFGRLLSSLESDYPLKCHNRAPYAYVITVPHFVYQCLILLLTGYIALSVMCNHTLILCQPKAAWSATLLKHTKMFHTNLVDADEDWHDISITSTRTSHAHLAWTTGSDNLRHYNWSYGQNYNYGTVGLLR